MPEISKSIYSTSETDPAFAFTEDNEALVVDAGVYIKAKSAVAIVSNYSGSDIIDNGLIVGYVQMFYGDNSALSPDSMTVSSTGVLVDGVVAWNPNSKLVNDGRIEGFAYSVTTGNGVEIDNNGLMTADGFQGQGVDLEGKNDKLLNTGRITDAEIGVYLQYASGHTIINSGLIKGSGFSIWSRAAQVNINNSGVLAGNVLLAASNDLINSGSIRGSVTFESGRNVYNGRGGTVTGPITGGTGPDTLIAGENAERLIGGGGTDKLYTGAGSDTLVFTDFGSSTADTIHGFRTGKDVIELDGTYRFAGLVSGQTPGLEVGTHISNTTDHLLYNPSSGALFYQADSAHQTNLIATLIGAPALSARDIRVV